MSEETQLPTRSVTLAEAMALLAKLGQQIADFTRRNTTERDELKTLTFNLTDSPPYLTQLAPARCVRCGHAWVAENINPYAWDVPLECPSCEDMTGMLV